MKSKLCRSFNKSGVSPLIATVLLVSFAIALGAIALNWGRNIDISKPGDKCAGISIKLRTANNLEACYSGSGQNGYINFIIDNNGNIDISGLGIWITGEKGTKLLDFNNFSIEKGELLDISDDSVKYDFSAYGSIKYIQFFPKVKFDSSIDICTGSSIKADKIRAC